MVYIDFDGVILDTENILFKELNENHIFLSDEEFVKYVKEFNWKYVIENAKEINDSVYYLKQMNPECTSIITRIHSLSNEAYRKVEWLRKNNINLNIYFVPYNMKKSDIVLAKNNVLIDDGITNLIDWKNDGGIPILYNPMNESAVYEESNFRRIENLSKVLKRINN